VISTGRWALYGSTTAAFGLVARSLIGHPVPYGASLGALGLYCGVLLTGVLDPRLSMYVDFENELPEQRDATRIALTFDDGPDLECTPRVLDRLDAAGMKATFFVIGRKLVDPAAKALVREAIARGHAVGSHSFGHPRTFAFLGEKALRAEIGGGRKSLEDVIGRACPLFRPPIGHSNPTVARVVTELGCRPIGWSVRGRDGVSGARVEAVVRRIDDAVTDGSIVALHDAAERDDRAPIAAAVLDALLPLLAARGLPSVALEPERASS
jgi:peptidoglycan/xylan/chitin deacetylase (PgdA/CDA1 family)